MENIKLINFNLNNDLNELHDFLSNNYIEGTNNINKLIYSKNFLFWIIKQSEEYNLSIKLVYKNKIIGFITGSFHNFYVEEYKKIEKLVAVNFLCIR